MSSDTPQDLDADIEFKRAQRKSRVQAALLLGVVLAVIGAIPWLFGYGVFGADLFSDEDVEIHVMNDSMTSALLTIRRTGGPFGVSETHEIEGRHVESFGTLGGQVEISLEHDDRALLENESYTLSSDLFLSTNDEACFVVFNLDPLYQSDAGPPSSLPIVERFGPQRIDYVSQSDGLVLPSKVNPDRKLGSLHWVETFNCDLVQPENESNLQEVALNTLTVRRQRLEEARERRRQALENAR